MSSTTLKNNKGGSCHIFVSVHPDIVAADPDPLTMSQLYPPKTHTHTLSSNHIHNSDLTLWAVLIKRKLVFIFKLLHQFRLISKSLTGTEPQWFHAEIAVFAKQSSFFKAIRSGCNGFCIVVWLIKECQGWQRTAEHYYFKMLPRGE